MAYATQQDLIDRYGEDTLIQLTDRTNLPATTIDASVVATAITDAEELADSYLSKRYSVPLSPVPGVLTRVICQIALYVLHGRGSEKDDPVTRDHERALAWLKDAGKGNVQLESDGAAAAQTAGGSVQTISPDRVFSRESLGGF